MKIDFPDHPVGGWVPSTNSWRVYFNKTGCSHYHVKVPCPACGGVTGRKNRTAMKMRLAERKAAGDIPLAR